MEEAARLVAHACAGAGGRGNGRAPAWLPRSSRLAWADRLRPWSAHGTCPLSPIADVALTLGLERGFIHRRYHIMNY